MWGTGPADVWAVLGPIGSTEPRLAHWDGQAWTVLPSLGFTPLGGVSHMAGASATDLWLVGETIIHGNGVQFQEVTTTGTGTVNSLTSVAIAAAPDDVWTTGTSGFARHQPTGRWKATPYPFLQSSINLLWPGGPNDLWAIYDPGSPSTPTLSRWNGTAWSDLPAQLAGLRTPHHAWGASADDVWIAGSSSVHVVGGQVASDPTVPSSASDVWGTAPDDVWMVGQSISHWNGQGWTQMGGNLNLHPTGVWGSGRGDVWFIADSGIMGHYDGQTISLANSGVLTRLSGIWGNARDNAWIVGDGGVILHWNGSAWIASPSGTTRNLVALTGTAAGEVWVVGAGGAVLHRPAMP
jgi:hypothetical protein